jgi:hypothetical protein
VDVSVTDNKDGNALSPAMMGYSDGAEHPCDQAVFAGEKVDATGSQTQSSEAISL